MSVSTTSLAPTVRKIEKNFSKLYERSNNQKLDFYELLHQRFEKIEP
ncbi:hypothetical protein RB2150_00260 [Rhodobacterales bacterium HTCC2150]|nr:hypothetical protein RB2150_00260 [Rhodobacterales bacterium HTCC2150] [Rhodobacteraceae bacterium HTCC2150]